MDESPSPSLQFSASGSCACARLEAKNDGQMVAVMLVPFQREAHFDSISKASKTATRCEILHLLGKGPAELDKRQKLSNLTSIALPNPETGSSIWPYNAFRLERAPRNTRTHTHMPIKDPFFEDRRCGWGYVRRVVDAT